MVFCWKIRTFSGKIGTHHWNCMFLDGKKRQISEGALNLPVCLDFLPSKPWPNLGLWIQKVFHWRCNVNHYEIYLDNCILVGARALSHCSNYDKKFTKQSSLKVHNLTHTGEKPFACSKYDKKFTKQGSLKVHNLTHTGEKSFACSKCDKKFAKKGFFKYTPWPTLERSHLPVQNVTRNS